MKIVDNQWIIDIIKGHVEGTANTLNTLNYALKCAERGDYRECFYALEEINFYNKENDFMIELERKVAEENEKNRGVY